MANAPYINADFEFLGELLHVERIAPQVYLVRDKRNPQRQKSFNETEFAKAFGVAISTVANAGFVFPESPVDTIE